MKSTMSTRVGVVVRDIPSIGNSNKDPVRKRKREGKSKNPLSDARKATQNTSLKSKKQQQVETLWHRKTGAGFALFVSYYGEQPPGVVVVGDEDTECGISIRKPSISHAKGAGQSRASLRRKKKRKSKEIIDEARPAASVNTTMEDSVSQLSNHPLFEALASSSLKYRHIVPFLEALSKPLPLTFRLRQHCAGCNNIDYQTDLRKLKECLSRHSALISPVTYDPYQRIYQATNPDLSKRNLSRISASLKKLLVENSANGMLARQELGSMLPVLALSGGSWLKRGSRVLDMCASPGSKALQALELVGSTDQNSTERDESSTGSKRKLGRLVASDVHPSRLQALEEAIGRSGLPPSLTSRVAYTNFDASCFPNPKSGKLFDAIIADVPCSGDGTIRKDSHILPIWTPSTSNALHPLQVRILSRALELVKVGGVVCYSTCSLNPVEDEAVVAAALRAIQTKQETMGSSKNTNQSESYPTVEIVEWPVNLLPGLIRRRGVASWRVAGYTGEGGEIHETSDEDEDAPKLQWYSTYEDSVESGMTNTESTMWPKDSNHELHLERCTRLWPQDNDTGGFFVALLKRNR